MSTWVSPLGSHDLYDQPVGTYLGRVAVKDDKGDTVMVNADDIGSGIKAIGEGIAKIGEGIKYSFTLEGHNHEYRPVYINGQNNPFTYIQESTTGSTAGTANFRVKFDTGTSAKDVGALAWSNEAVYQARGPTRTHTWYHDNTLDGTTAFVWDNGCSPVNQKKIDEANKKSMELLKNWLSDAEYNYLMEGDLELPSQYEKDTIYIVNKDPMRRIGIKKKGKVVEKSLCIHASHQYADGDVLLANIMLLKSDEKKFLEIANVHDYLA